MILSGCVICCARDVLYVPNLVLWADRFTEVDPSIASRSILYARTYRCEEMTLHARENSRASIAVSARDLAPLWDDSHFDSFFIQSLVAGAARKP